MFHEPVLLKEVLEIFAVKPGENFLDCNLGGGGHAGAILEKNGPDGRLLGLDLDLVALKEAKKSLKGFGERVVLVQDNFANLERIVEEKKFSEISGIIFDLGLSSFELENSGRGFTFTQDEPLDMRFDASSNIGTAAELLNGCSIKDLTSLFRNYGELPNAPRLAAKIFQNKGKTPRTTYELKKLALQVRPKSYRFREEKYLAQVFQALRIAVNKELESLEKGLKGALSVLAPGGKMVVLAYHSLEDRIVKNFFRQESKDCLCPPEIPICVCGHRRRLEIINKKVITANSEEINLNKKSRSAKLRAAKKI